MKLTFIGGKDEVTGSMILLETESEKYLIDSGLYQGSSETVKKNLTKLPFHPKEIKALFLTHAHLDHSGYIPRLVKLGFRGPIYCTEPTVKLARLILADSAELISKKNSLLHQFYSSEDAGIAYGLFQDKEFNSPFALSNMQVTFIPAGHILGAASIKISSQGKSYLFSGDLGRSNDALMPPPLPCPPVDVVVMESTYGDRKRSGNLQDDLSTFLKQIQKESKIGIVACFAVARAQMIITLIYEYYRNHPDEKVRVVMDGPMMSEANKIYMANSDKFNCPSELKHALGNVENILHNREWETLQKSSGPLIILSSSGMLTGGRIWRHLINWHQDKNAIIYLPGFQSPGTPGHALKSGLREIENEEGIRINWAGEVWSSDSFSSHADQEELLNWTKQLSKETEIYLNHGEENSKIALKNKLVDLGFLQVTIA
jgi:metallo-beta-lactamase family protein